jgi:hypothetical protein
MMIPFISRYRQQWHYERDYWLTRAEKRRAMWFVCAITAVITTGVLLWLLQ